MDRLSGNVSGIGQAKVAHQGGDFFRSSEAFDQRPRTVRTRSRRRGGFGSYGVYRSWHDAIDGNTVICELDR